MSVPRSFELMFSSLMSDFLFRYIIAIELYQSKVYEPIITRICKDNCEYKLFRSVINLTNNFENICMNQGQEDRGEQPLLSEEQKEQFPSTPDIVEPTTHELNQNSHQTKGIINIQLKDEKPHDKAQPVSFFKLLSLSDKQDVVMMVIGTICALAAGAVMPMFSFFFGDITMIYIKPDPVGEALKAAIKFWIIGGAAWILNFGALYCWTASGQRQALRYRKLYYKLLLKQEVYWYDVNNPNQLSTRISTEVTSIQAGIAQKVANIMTISVTGILGFFLAYYRNWQLSLVISATVPALMIAGMLMVKAMQLSTNKNTQTYSEAGAIAEQAIGSIRTIKGLVGELFEIKKYKQKLDEALGGSIKYSYYAAASVGFMIMVFLSSYSLGFWYGKKLILDNDNYDIGTVISCLFCIVMGSASLGQAAPALKNIAAAKAAAGEFFKLYERQTTLKQPKKGEQVEKIQNIEFKDIVFRYKKKDQADDVQSPNVINGLNLKFSKNKVTAIVGQSGSGKSTIVQLLQRFYDPDQGTIEINGIDLKKLNSKHYRQKIGYVGQEPALFALSIRENLLFAKEDATEEQMIDSLKKANAWQFISKMDYGLDTFVGAAGAQISGGQKQRIAIARAILKNPSLFIFDEATSALDRMNQREIQSTLSKLSENITTVVIAHRLSTIQNADKIIVLSKGKVVEQGTHQQMIQAKSFYYNLVKNQLLVDETTEEKEVKQLGDVPTVQRGESIASKKQIVEDEDQKKQRQKKQGAVFTQLLKDSSQNWIWYVFGVICAALNGVVFPLFSLIMSNLIGLMAELRDQSKDQSKIIKQINWYCLGFLGIAIAGGVATFAYHSSFGYIGQKLVYKIRQKVFNKLMRLSVSYYDIPTNNPGAVTTKLAQDAHLIHNMTTGVFGVIVLNVSTITAGLFLAFYNHWMLALIVIGLSPLLAIAGAINMKRLKKLGEKADQSFQEAGNQISDTVVNIRTVRSFGNQEYIQKQFQKKLQQPYKLAKDKAISNGFFQGLSQAAIMLVYGLIFYLAAVINEKVEGQKHTTSEIFTAIFAIVFAAVGMGNNSQMMPDMAKGKTAGASLYQILNTQDQYEKSLEQGGVVRENIRGEIQFKGVSFKFPSREKRVFKNLNLKILGTQKTAFVGQSGCGKSTIFQLLLRFYEPDSGQIRLDGRNIREYDLYHLRSQIGIVFQEPVLFSGSIIENIRYKNTQATQRDVIEAAKAAEAHDFISNFKTQDNENSGYNSDVGNKGSKLSGGQKQRVALARCILSKPNIFMFDESTSALDTQTEKKVFQSLQKTTKGKTTLSIAHRLSTIVDNDQIYVFSQGEIIEQGTYQELVNKGGFFYRLERGQH